MDRKRRGAPLEGIPEAKRPLRAISGSAAPSAASGRAVSTSRSSKDAAAGSAAAPQAAPAAAKPDETWEDIVERTGMTVDELLNKKLTFKKGTLPAKKLEEMGPVIKELK